MALTRPKIWDIDTNIEWFQDPITVLHQGATSANVDVGFLFNRANGLVSNVALYWNESTQNFVTAYTSSDGTTNTNIAVTSYANITTGNVTANSIITTGNINSGNVLATGFFYANGAPFVSSNYGNVQMLANLAATGNPVTIGSNLTISGNTVLANTTVSTNNSSIVQSGSHLTLANPTGSQTSIGFTFGGTAYAEMRVDNGGNFLLSGSSGNFYFDNDLGASSPVNFKGPGGITFQTVTNGTNSVNFPGNVTVGNLAVTGNITTINYETVLYTETANVLTANTLTVSGVANVGNLITTGGVFWANGNAYSSGGGGGSNSINPALYLGKVTATTAPTLIDTLPFAGNNRISWRTTSYDSVNTQYRVSTIDSLNNGSTVYYNEYGVILSNVGTTVATFSSNITGSNINLYATGNSSSVAVTFERLVLGSSTAAGYFNVGPAGTVSNIAYSSGNVTITGNLYITSNATSGTTTRVEYNIPHPFMLMGAA